MAAITKRLLHLRPSSHSITRPYPYTHRHFSSSDSDHDDPPKPEAPPSVSLSLNDVRANLQNAPQPPGDSPQPPRSPSSFPSGAPFRTPPPSGDASGDDLSKLLANFRSLSAPRPASGEKHPSMHGLYLKNVISKGESPGGSYSAIRQSLSSMPPANAGRKPGNSRSDFPGLSFYADPSSKFGGGSGGSSSPSWSVVSGKMGDGRELQAEFNTHKHSAEFGKKLQARRPEKRKGNWFSLQELRNRMTQLRYDDMVEHERVYNIPQEISDTIHRLSTDSRGGTNKSQQMTVGILGSVSATGLVEKTGPPKDQLYEQYFHPDHMSAAEKMKLELAKVREEFKMSESDCGSARVQVAQLTTKIKYLSTSLHKKDKHSRRGLLAMVQRRKRLLKYLRRTDWDSYCLVLLKLGLRDNHDIKADMPKLR